MDVVINPLTKLARKAKKSVSMMFYKQTMECDY